MGTDLYRFHTKYISLRPIRATNNIKNFIENKNFASRKALTSWEQIATICLEDFVSGRFDLLKSWDSVGNRSRIHILNEVKSLPQSHRHSWYHLWVSSSPGAYRTRSAQYLLPQLTWCYHAPTQRFNAISQVDCGIEVIGSGSHAKVAGLSLSNSSAF